MARIEIDLNKSFGWRPDDIRDLLAELNVFESVSGTDEVFVDLPNTRIADLALVLLWTKLRNLQQLPCKKFLRYGKKTSVKYLDDRHFFDRLVGKHGDKTSSNIPFHFETFALNSDEGETTEKVSSAVQNNISKMPLSSETKVHVSELVSNAFHHSESTGEVGCVSYFDPNTGFFDFCISDQGKGVKRSFSRNKDIAHFYAGFSDSDILEVAANRDVTCNPKDARQYSHGNSGIGLYFLREFCKYHDGLMVILSGKGYYCVDAKKIRKKVFSDSWNGTAVYFRANLKNDLNPNYRKLVEDFVSDF